MGWPGALGGVISEFQGSQGDSQGHQDVESGFDRIAHMPPQGALADGLSAAFRSDQTPRLPKWRGSFSGIPAPANRPAG